MVIELIRRGEKTKFVSDLARQSTVQNGQVQIGYDRTPSTIDRVDPFAGLKAEIPDPAATMLVGEYEDVAAGSAGIADRRLCRPSIGVVTRTALAIRLGRHQPCSASSLPPA